MNKELETLNEMLQTRTDAATRRWWAKWLRTDSGIGSESKDALGAYRQAFLRVDYCDKHATSPSEYTAALKYNKRTQMSLVDTLIGAIEWTVEEAEIAREYLEADDRLFDLWDQRGEAKEAAMQRAMKAMEALKAMVAQKAQ